MGGGLELQWQRVGVGGATLKVLGGLSAGLDLAERDHPQLCLTSFEDNILAEQQEYNKLQVRLDGQYHLYEAAATNQFHSMAAFSRGCSSFTRQSLFQLPPSLRLSTLIARPHSHPHTTTIRFFSRSPLLHAKPKKHSPSPSARAQPTPTPPQPKPHTPAAKPKPAPTPIPFQTTSLAQTLIAGGTPTLLYTAPSHSSFIVLSCTTSLFFFIYAGLASRFYLYPPEGTWWLVSNFYGVAAIMFTSIGTWIFAGPVGLVRSITAVPVVAAAAAAGAKPGGAAPNALNIRVVTRRSVLQPWRKVLEAPLAEVSIADKLAPATEMEAIGPGQERVEARRREVEGQSVLVRPFLRLGTWFSQSFFGLFLEVQNMTSRRYMTRLTVGGRRVWKVDIRGNMLDGGRGESPCEDGCESLRLTGR